MAVNLKAILRFDGKAYEAGMKKATATSKKAQKNIAGNLKGQIAGALAVGVLTNKAKEISEFTKQVQQLAPALGMTTTELQEWEYVFKRAGLEIDDVADAFATLADRTEDALSGTTSMQEDFRLVGLSIDQLRGKNPQQLFDTFADAVANTEDKNRALASIVRNLGDDLGRKLAPMLMLGKKGLADMRKEAQELGIVMDESNIADVASKMVEMQIASMKLRSLWADITYYASQFFTKLSDGLRALNPFTRLFAGMGAFVGTVESGGSMVEGYKAYGKAVYKVNMELIDEVENREKAAKKRREQAKAGAGFTRSKGGINDEIEAAKAKEAYEKKVNSAVFKGLDNEGKLNALLEKRAALMEKIKNASGKNKYELMGEQFDIEQQMGSLKTGTSATGSRTQSLTGAQGVGAFVRRANPMLKVAQNQLKVLEQIKVNTTKRAASTVENPYGSGTAAA